MKQAWRKVLLEWREGSGSKGSFEKSQLFQCLLENFMDTIEPNSKENFISGFRKCGISPLSLAELVTRLPQTTLDSQGLIEDYFLMKKETVDQHSRQETSTESTVSPCC